jgi:hypothetical protein
MATMTQTRECEFDVKSWTKPEQDLAQKCSLTGFTCVCPESYLTCTRRTFALDYQLKMQGRKVTVVCSEDRPQPPLPCP